MKIRVPATGLATVALVAALFAPSAWADSYSGDKSCPGTYTPQLRIDAGLPGNGSWTSNTTGASKPFSFPGGASYRYSPYQDVHWVTVAPWFYQKPIGTCW